MAAGWWLSLWRWMGAQVTAIDADATAIEGGYIPCRRREMPMWTTGSAHAEALVAAGMTFDLVLALEIIEHVADHALFLEMLGRLVAPRRAADPLHPQPHAQIPRAGHRRGFEHILRWVVNSVETHDWRKFVKPSDLARGLRAIGFEDDRPDRPEFSIR